MAYTKYSLTPANNTAAPPDGAPEGMLPSAVNDTMRDMMAQIRDCGDGVRDGTYTMTTPKITGGTITGVAITASTGSFTTLSTSSTTTFSGLTASTALALDASKNVVSVTNTGTGNNVLSASPTLTGTIAGASLSLSSLTSGRVTYAGASGLLSDTDGLTYDGTIFQVKLGNTATTQFRIAHSSAANYYADYNEKGDLTVGRNSWSSNTTTEFSTVSATSTYTGDVAGGFSFSPRGTLALRVQGNGIVTMPTYGAGTATFSAAGVISSVSDETWKTKDGVPTNTDAMLQKLEPGYWFYNEEKAPTFGQERQLGFYAQNVHEAIGEEAAPTPEEGKPWGYYDRSVLAITVMSLKNALNTIEEFKQRITALENK